MKVLLIHERYEQREGEDEAFDTESRLLEWRGHGVRQHAVSDDEIDEMGSLAVATAAIWNRSATRELGESIRSFGPDVAHFHNTFRLLAPPAYRATQRQGVPVVKTHHNYRLPCGNTRSARS